MRTPLLLLVPLLLSFAHAAEPDPVWVSAVGRRVPARFVRLRPDEKIVVLATSAGEEKSVPFAWFSPASLAMARELAVKHAYRDIAGIRAMKFSRIRHGRFTMGSPLRETGRIALEKPVGRTAAQADDPVPDIEPEHDVILTRDFWMKTTEVTRKEWNDVLSNAPPRGYPDISPGHAGSGTNDRDSHPVTDIAWIDAVKWCNLLSEIMDKVPAYYTNPDCTPDAVLKSGADPPHVKRDADGYRLPTEAEWEYACRGGKDGQTFHPATITSPGKAPDRGLRAVAWFGENSGSETHPVALRSPNSFKLHDMHGNVAEWCWDFYGLLSSAKEKDPAGPEKGERRVFRGGSWGDPARCCRTAYRGIYSPLAPSSVFVGFRPVCGSDPLAKTVPKARPKRGLKR